MDRPILFSGPMVRALLEGRKTQTRRVLKPQPPGWASFCEQPLMYNALHEWVPSGLWRWSEAEQNPPRALRAWPVNDDGHYWLHPGYAAGDRLWLREALVLWPGLAEYEGDGKPVVPSGSESREWIASYSRAKAPSIHMPRWASRLTLIVSDVRVQRLCEISEADAIAEGIGPITYPYGSAIYSPCPGVIQSPTFAFSRLWESINGKRDGCSWHDNPWVVAVTFTVIKANIDSLPAGGA